MRHNLPYRKYIYSWIDYTSGYSIKSQSYTYTNKPFNYEVSVTPHQLNITPECQIPHHEWDSLLWKSLPQAGRETNKKSRLHAFTHAFFSVAMDDMWYILQKAKGIVGINQIPLSPKTSLFRKEMKMFVGGIQMKYFTTHTVIEDQSFLNATTQKFISCHKSIIKKPCKIFFIWISFLHFIKR